jgi:hypothetical protein
MRRTCPARGKLPAADALSLVEAFHDDPEREVVERALGVALSVSARAPGSGEPDAQLPAIPAEEFSGAGEGNSAGCRGRRIG